jgi:dolichol-phosphate mannosyltransferase
MKVLVIIPTYNESQNIMPLTRQLLTQDRHLEILIVDDNSPDKTGEIAANLAKENPRVRVLHRPGKEGRGSACLEGFKQGINERADFIIEMDADFSHAPADVARLLANMDRCDVAIGSRYLSGSQIINWPPSRRIFSKLANIFVKSLLKIPITDYTNGFRCYRAEALRKLRFEEIDAKGFIALSSIASQLFLAGCRFGEIPIRFVNRRRGSSNLSLNEITTAFKEICKLWWISRQNREIPKICA